MVDDYMVSQGEAYEEEIEEKYFDNCRRVVSFYSCMVVPFPPPCANVTSPTKSYTTNRIRLRSSSSAQSFKLAKSSADLT